MLRYNAQTAWPCGGELAKHPFAPFASDQLVLFFIAVLVFFGFVVLVQSLAGICPQHAPTARWLCTPTLWQPPSTLAARCPQLTAAPSIWAQFGCAGTGSDMLTRWTRVLARQHPGGGRISSEEKHWTHRQKDLCRKACHHLLPLPLLF